MDTPKELQRTNPVHPFVPGDSGLRSKNCEEVFSIQSAGLAKRILHTKARSLVIGVSGGLDSTLALLVCVRALQKLPHSNTKIEAITMPGLATSARTKTNATQLCEELNISLRTISIDEAVQQHFSDIGHDSKIHDVTYENSQARERTQILMDIANQTRGIVVGTGDLSELALGWCTYNGDHMSMYSVNSGVPKTLVRYLVEWCAEFLFEGKVSEILRDICDTPVSPELVPGKNPSELQQTEKILGPYEVHDFFLFHFLRHQFSPSKIHYLATDAFQGIYSSSDLKNWLLVFLKRFFQQQFKRSALPDGPKVGSVALSPRGDWRMPSDADGSLWLQEAESIVL